jgi:alcohol dehydrogenase class IV
MCISLLYLTAVLTDSLKVLNATESGLESLRHSLESLTKVYTSRLTQVSAHHHLQMVQEQRREGSSRDQSTSADREKKD